MRNSRNRLTSFGSRKASNPFRPRMKGESKLSDTWKARENYWNLYARAFAQSLGANSLLSSFVTNPNVTGAYAEAWIRSMARNMLGHRFRISTGAVIRSCDNIPSRGLSKVSQCDLIVRDPSEMPAIFECSEFALVPLFATRAVIEVKRTGNKAEREELAEQLKKRQNLLPIPQNGFHSGGHRQRQRRPAAAVQRRAQAEPKLVRGALAT